MIRIWLLTSIKSPFFDDLCDVCGTDAWVIQQRSRRAVPIVPSVMSLEISCFLCYLKCLFYFVVSSGVDICIGWHPLRGIGVLFVSMFCQTSYVCFVRESLGAICAAGACNYKFVFVVQELFCILSYRYFAPVIYILAVPMCVFGGVLAIM